MDKEPMQKKRECNYVNMGNVEARASRVDRAYRKCIHLISNYLEMKAHFKYHHFTLVSGTLFAACLHHNAFSAISTL